MFCIKCGKELPDDAQFCFSCGKPVYNEKPIPESGINGASTDEIKSPTYEREPDEIVKKESSAESVLPPDEIKMPIFDDDFDDEISDEPDDEESAITINEVSSDESIVQDLVDETEPEIDESIQENDFFESLDQYNTEQTDNAGFKNKFEYFAEKAIDCIVNFFYKNGKLNIRNTCIAWVCLVVIVILIVCLIIKKDNSSKSGYSNSNTSKQTISVSKTEDEYVPFINEDDLGCAGAKNSLETIQAMGFVRSNNTSGIDLSTITLTKDQELWSANVYGVVMAYIYDNKAGYVVGDHWIFGDSAIANVRTGYSSLVEANVDPLIVRFKNSGATASVTNLIWKYKGGYFILGVQENGADNWPEWNVLWRTTIEDKSQIDHFDKAERFHVDLSNVQGQNSVSSEDSSEKENADGYTKVVADNMGELPSAIFDAVKGHYSDGHGDTLDVYSPDRMYRFVKGGNYNPEYDEEIAGYKVLDNGYLLKISWGGDKYTYLYQKQKGKEYMYVNFYEEWDPELFPYAHEEDYQVYVKESRNANVPDLEALHADDPTESKQYYTFSCELKKEDGYYYLCPRDTDAFTATGGYSIEGFPTGEVTIDGSYMDDSIPFTKKIKISKNAMLGVASDSSIIPDPEGYYFDWKYNLYRFYDKADEFMKSKHWVFRDDGVFCFINNGDQVPWYPIVTFNEDGEIDSILEFFAL